MDTAHILGYEDSPNFLLAEEDFPHAQELGYVFRKAKIACGLKGVYALRAENDSASPIPVLYFCQATPSFLFQIPTVFKTEYFVFSSPEVTPPVFGIFHPPCFLV